MNKSILSDTDKEFLRKAESITNLDALISESKFQKRLQIFNFIPELRKGTKRQIAEFIIHCFKIKFKLKWDHQKKEKGGSWRGVCISARDIADHIQASPLYVQNLISKMRKEGSGIFSFIESRAMTRWRRRKDDQGNVKHTTYLYRINFEKLRKLILNSHEEELDDVVRAEADVMSALRELDDELVKIAKKPQAPKETAREISKLISPVIKEHGCRNFTSMENNIEYGRPSVATNLMVAARMMSPNIAGLTGVIEVHLAMGLANLSLEEIIAVNEFTKIKRRRLKKDDLEKIRAKT